MLSTEAAGEHVRRHYGIAGAVERVAKGRASNYCISGGGGRWLLKVFQPEYTKARLEQAAAFVSFVARSGYPAREFVSARDGASVLTIEDRAAILIPWIDGDTPEPNTLSSPEMLAQVGALCGRMHRLGDAYPHAHMLGYAGSTRSLAEKRAALLRLAKQETNLEIADEARCRADILESLGEEVERSQARARQGIIHGDFSGAHVVFQDDRAVGVIDVLGERYLPGWELMRAFFQSVPSSSVDTIEAPWRAYVSGYASEHPITPDEIAIAYDTYLLQLTSSTYGLRAPLDDQLRAFGRWRTALAQQLARNRTGLRAMMTLSAS